MLEKTVIQIVTQAERELHQSAGMAVQVYSQDLLAQYVQNGFTFIFDDVEHRWKRFESSVVYTLDGTTGHTTVPVINTFKHYEDITHVYPGSSTRPLAGWNGGNPSALLGLTAIFYRPGSTDVINCLPTSASGNITVCGKLRPAEFDIQSNVPFDYLTLVYFAAWQYMVDDATNPAAVDKLRNLFEQRYKQMKQLSSQEPIALNGEYGNIPLTWRDEG